MLVGNEGDSAHNLVSFEEFVAYSMNEGLQLGENQVIN